MPDDSSTAAAKKINRGHRGYLDSAVTLVGVGAVGWFAASGGWGSLSESTTLVSAAWAITTFLLAWTAETAAHELGHLTAAQLVGFRFASISVFPITLSRGPRGWKFGLTSEQGGHCFACPKDARDLRRRYIVYILGGPVGGLIASAVCALVVWLGGVPPGRLADFLAWWALLGLVSSILNLIPFKGESDGYYLNVLRRAGSQADQMVAALATQVLDALGVRYRDMNRELVDTLTRPAYSPDWQRIGHNAAYLAAIDSGRLNDARPLLDRLWELSAATPGAPDTALELAYFAAVHEENAPEARRHFDQAGGQGSPCARDLAEAAVLLAEGQPAAARAVLDAIPPGFLDLAREGTGSMQLIADQAEDLIARAGVGEQT